MFIPLDKKDKEEYERTGKLSSERVMYLTGGAGSTIIPEKEAKDSLIEGVRNYQINRITNYKDDSSEVNHICTSNANSKNYTLQRARKLLENEIKNK